MNNPIYLDCNATTPPEPEVQEILLRYLVEEFGNEGSRTHGFGTRAKQAVQLARDQVAAVVDVQRDEVAFTSGATESNNIAILGLAEHGKETGKRHLITTGIEHKAVQEPFEALERQGFDVSYLPVGSSGRLDASVLAEALQADTLLVSVMQANNETGVLQPLDEVCEVLVDHPAYLHTDAAQGFGKELGALRNARIDLISISGHKIFGPKGVGALITKRRGYDRPPLTPLAYGGGQERGLRPGTLPVALIAALGCAAEIAIRDHDQRTNTLRVIRQRALDGLSSLEIELTGDLSFVMPHVLNFRVPGLDSEALMLAVKDLIAISNGSACTSASYTPSHVLTAMGFSEDEANECIRISWSHLTPDVDWEGVVNRLQKLT